MSKSIKLKNDNYLDSSSIIHNKNDTRYNLKTLLNFISTFYNGFDGLFGNSSDLDTTKYLISIASVGANGIPSGLNSNACMVITSNSNTMYRGQIAFSFGADKLAIRRCYGSNSWTEWKYVSFS